MRIALILAVLLFAGCSSEQVDRASAFAAAAHAELDQAQGQVDQLKVQLAVAKDSIKDLHSAKADALVAQFEQVVATAEKGLPAIRTAAEAADSAFAQIKASDSGEVPWWKVALGVAIPVLLPFAKAIPGVGPIVGSLGELAWNAYTTADAKARQAKIEAEARALPDQVKVAHAALAALPADAAKAIKDAAFDAQALNGTLDAIRPHVAAVEAKA